MVIIRLAGGGHYDPNLNPNDPNIKDHDEPNIKEHDDAFKDHDNPNIKDQDNPNRIMMIPQWNHNDHLQVQGTWDSFWRVESWS